MHEFELINYYFNKKNKSRPDVVLGIGDDGALLKTTAKQNLVVSIDTLVSDVHFAADVDAASIGHKSLAVNLSDLAAMGASPAWLTLALTIPEANNAWLKKFSTGLFKLIQKYNLQLVGGDLTRGPLAITIQAHGFVPEKLALRRDKAKPGDLIYVTGSLGDAGLGLLINQKKLKNIKLTPAEKKYFLNRLSFPTPRVEIGLALRKISRCAIDVSDGLIADLGHILKSSKVGASIFIDQIPISKNLNKLRELALTAGDDYELCFTIPNKNKLKLEKVFNKINCPYTLIGIIEKQPGLRIKNPDGSKYKLKKQGYRHF